MKKVTKSLVFVLVTVLALGFTGCKKDKGIDGGSWALSLGGTSKSGSTSLSTYTSITQQLSVSLYLSGSLGNPPTLTLTATNPTTGAHTLDGTNYSASYTTTTDNYTVTQSPAGTVNFSTIDITGKKVSGTFSFHAINDNNPNDSVVITNGTINGLNLTVI